MLIRYTRRKLLVTKQVKRHRDLFDMCDVYLLVMTREQMTEMEQAKKEERSWAKVRKEKDTVGKTEVR